MKKSKISILLLVMVMILAISAVSAADTNDTSDSAVQAVDEAPIEEVASEDVDAVAATDNTDVLAADGDGNFTELQNSVDSSGTVIMSKDYTRVEGESTLSITKDVTLIGNNQKIDGNNLGGIFNVNSGCTLTLMGVTLINGNAENGGAIYNNGGTLTIVNSNFLNNTATKSGGAIYNDGGSITVTGSTFDGNDLTDRSTNGWGGAAIYDNAGTVLISTSRITNNLKDIVHRGGTGQYTGDLSSAAVTSKNGALTVSDSYFGKNSGSYGGAILSQGDSAVLNVVGSTFEDNFAFNGGAINIVSSKYTISNSTFRGNNAKGTGSSTSNYANGGAICAQENDNDDGVISDCTFKDNTAAIGGAITTQIALVTGCTFTNNTALSSNSESFNGKTNNKGGFGGAVYNDNTITIEDSNFTDSIGRGRGLDLKNADISGSSFTNTIINVNNHGTVSVSDNLYDNAGKDISSNTGCTVAVTVGNGEIPLVTSGTIIFDGDLTFQDLQDIVDAGNTAITLTGNVLKSDEEEQTFANGILINHSFAIYAQDHTITANNGKVFTVNEGATLSLYKANVVGDGTTAIVNNGQVSLSLTNPSTFTNVGEFAIDNQGTVSQTSLTTFTQLSDLIALVNGGEIYIGQSKITKADDEKAAFADGIVIEKDLTIRGYFNSYYKYIDTKIDADNDGRIFSVNDGATLTLQKIILTNGNDEKGGAVYVEANNNFYADTVNFINNTATYRGGAIYSEGFVNVTNCVFDSNDITFRTANDDNGGAAIYNLRGILLIKDSKITNNLKDIVIRDGNSGDLLVGAVVTSGETIIDNVYFANNTGSWGGAISSVGYLNPDDYVLSVLNSKFEGNNATFGGAIFVESSNLDVRNCTFENNRGVGVGSSGTSDTQGGAIVIFPGDSHAEIIDSTFIGNSANLGGAVSFPGVASDTFVDNCTFVDNSAVNGGAVYFFSEEGSLSVSNSDFVGNDASAWGGAICVSDNASITITESNFEENTAAAATIVTFGSSSLAIDGCNFTENANTYDWGVVTVYSTGDANIENSEFINDVTGSIAIDVENNANVNVEDSKISTTNRYGIWAGDGNLSLENNDISSAYVPVITSGGTEIVSTVRANISENKTYNGHLGAITVTINLTDDSGNLVYDANLKFVVYKDGEVVFNESAAFDGEKYTGTFTPTKPGTYIVTLDYPAQEVATAAYVISSSLTDLKNKIGNDTTGSITLDIDYSYIEEYDAGLENGIVIDKNIIIDGNGSTICGSDAARIFNVVNGATLTLSNATLCDGNATHGGAVYVEAGAAFNADAVNFNDNTAKLRGGAIWSAGTVDIKNSAFDSNNITYRKENKDYGGAAIYSKGTLTVDKTRFTNDLTNYVVRTGDENDPQKIDGVVLATGGTAYINNSYFENNSGTYGGAVSGVPADGCDSVSLTVENSMFINNLAYAGGAIYAGSGTTELKVKNCTFIGNNATGIGSTGYTSAGGAISINRDTTATINDSKFINNTATIGGAVDVSATKNSVAVSIDNCSFENNVATGSPTRPAIGGAIRIGSTSVSSDKLVISVENSNFTDNVASAGGSAINNGGTLTLSGNKVFSNKAEINSTGTINSLEYATFLGNETVPGEQGDIFILNATLTDEKGNFIYDADFSFSVNGETINGTLFDAETGLYTVGYYIGTAGPKVISTNYEATGLTKYTGILDVPKANVTEFYVGTGTATKIPYGENVTVFVGLRGVNAEGLNKTIKVIVNNTEYTVTLIDGEYSFNVSGLAPGEYPVFAIFDGDDNYNGAYANGLFNVLYPNPILKVVTQDITYGEDAIINISLTEADGRALQGTLTIKVNDFITMIDWVGENSIRVPNLAANETGWIVSVSYTGDDLHSNVYNETEVVKVAKATPTVDITGPFDINMGEDADFTATVDAKVDGIALNIWVDGVNYISMGPGEWDSNVAKFVITSDWLPEARDYNITVQFIGNENYTASENVSQILTVNKIDVGPIIQISGSTVTYGENATVTVELPMDAEGNVTVTIDGVTFNGTVEGGIAVVEIPGLGVGLYEMFAVDYSGDNKYSSHSGMATVEVKQAKSSVEIKPIEEVTYGNNVTIEYTVLNATTIKINVGYGGLEPVYNATIVANVSEYDGSFVLSNLAAGEYLVVVYNDDSDNYTFSVGSVYFTVNKAEPTMQTEITSDIKAGDEGVVIKVVLPEDATGKVMLLIDDEPVTQMDYNLINGTVNITVPADIVTAGRHSYYVSYDGDDNYTSAYDFKSFEVSKVTPTVTIVLDGEVGVAGGALVNISVASDATGKLLIDNNGALSSVELTNGNYTLEIYDLVAGEYYINVTYIGDDKYSEANASKVFTVPKSDVTIEYETVTPEIKYGETAVVKVDIDPDFATGNVTIFVDNVTYGTFDLDEDYANATILIFNLAMGSHNITVTYNGDENYNAKTGIRENAITVTKGQPTIHIMLDHDVIEVGSEISVLYGISGEVAGGNISIRIDGVECYNKPIASKVDYIDVVSDLLTPGNHTVSVQYLGDELNNPSNVAEDNVTVLNMSEITINIDTPANSTDLVFNVTLPRDAEGYLLVDIADQHYYAPVKNGTAVVSVPGLAPGNYTATVTYSGDDKYENITVNKKVTVPSNLPEDAITVPETADTDSPVTYEINLPADAGGYLEVDVDGTKYIAALNNGSASVTVPALSEGEHNVTVKYSGDGKYSSASKDTKLSVHVPVYNIAENKDVSAIYYSTAYYKVLVTKDGKAVAAGESVTIKYNGKTYTVKTDSKGYATLKLNTKVKVKKYTITAEYKGVKVTNKVTIKHVIKAKNKKVKKSKKVTKVKITLKKVNGKVLKAKKLKVKFRGKKYTVKTNKKGVATWKVKKSMLKKLKVGKKYKYKVTFGKDVVTKKLTIKK